MRRLLLLLRVAADEGDEEVETLMEEGLRVEWIDWKSNVSRVVLYRELPKMLVVVYYYL